MTARTDLPDGGSLDVSVVIATYNRTNSLLRLLKLLDEQTVAASRVEVIVVDDESVVDVAEAVRHERLVRCPQVIRQKNGGPAVARDAGIRRARAGLVVVLDDDMIVAPDFIAAHLEAHADEPRAAVLGRLREPPGMRLRLFDRMQLALLDRLFDDVAAGLRRPSGGDMYTGNVSFRRADYLAVGGFDHTLRLSEDAELGMRLEAAGVKIVLSERAVAWHASDHASLTAWVRRSIAYGEADAAISRKQGPSSATDVWRYLFLVHPVSRPFLLASALAPALLVPVARVAILVAMGVDRLGLERLALAGATFAYGILYFAGVRREAGSLVATLEGAWRYLRRRRDSGARNTDATTTPALRCDARDEQLGSRLP